MSANALYAFGSLNAIGFSPYAPELLSTDERKVIADACDVVDQLTPLILANRALNGDDTNQGRELRLPAGQFTIRRLRLYRYH